MNWGWKIVLVYVGFVAMILTLVMKARSLKVELVATNYYEQEVAYQQRIDAIHRTQNLRTPIQIGLNNGVLNIAFPKECNPLKMNGTIKMYRPSDSSLDKEWIIELNENKTQSIPMQDLKNGQYIVQIGWTQDGLHYYKEEVVIL